MANIIKKLYQNTLGLDLRSSDLLRQEGAATLIKNLQYRQTGAMSKRKGFKNIAESGVGGNGLVTFNNIDIGTGTVTEELITIDDQLNLRHTNTFTITYTGATSAYFDVYFNKDDSNYYFDLYEDNARILNESLGNGFAVSDLTIAQIQTLVNAETGFAMSVSGNGSAKAALVLDPQRVVTVGNPGTSVSFYNWVVSEYPGTYDTPFAGIEAAKNQVDFELCTFAQIQDVLYVSNAYDGLHKYDGICTYKAGLPKPTILTNGTEGAGSLDANAEYSWKYTYEYIDSKANVITSADSVLHTFTTTGASKSVILSVGNLMASSGYLVDQGIVNGNQGTSTTITLDSGHTIKSGQYVYYYDTAAADLVSSKVVSTTTTTIVLESAHGGVTDNYIVSTLKIDLWRTQGDGLLFYLSKSFTNDNANATTSYTDGAADTALVIEKIEPVKVPAPPPTCAYIDVWRGQLIMSGNRESVNTVYYSDFDIESFPLDQSFTAQSRTGGGVTAVKSLDNNLFVFKPEAVISVTGDLGTDSFQVNALTDEGIGCVSMQTIQEINGKLWFLSKNGVYSANLQGMAEESSAIKPRFSNKQYTEKRAMSYHWVEKELYILHLPQFQLDNSSDKYINADSKIYVMDLFRNAWLEWSSIPFTDGITKYNDDVYFTGRVQDITSALSSVEFYKLSNFGTEADYVDHYLPIEFDYKSHWEALNEPSIFKKFLRIKIHSLDGAINDFETDTFELTIETEQNYSSVSVGSLTLDFSGGAEGWGESPWGQFPWGESRLEQLTSKLQANKAKSLRVRFYNNNLLENILISGYELEIALPYDTQIKE